MRYVFLAGLLLAGCSNSSDDSNETSSGGASSAGAAGKGGAASGGSGVSGGSGGATGGLSAGGSAGSVSTGGGAGGAGGTGGISIGTDSCGNLSCNECEACSVAEGGACRAIRDACTADPDCSGYEACVDGCSSIPCINGCRDQFPNGIGPADNANDCVACVSCRFACPFNDELCM